jgi:hypothetical protein
MVIDAFAECCYAECRNKAYYAERRYAKCRGTLKNHGCIHKTLFSSKLMNGPNKLDCSSLAGLSSPV